jgi:hypothetical protein
MESSVKHIGKGGMGEVYLGPRYKAAVLTRSYHEGHLDHEDRRMSPRRHVPPAAKGYLCSPTIMNSNRAM